MDQTKKIRELQASIRQHNERQLVLAQEREEQRKRADKAVAELDRLRRMTLSERLTEYIGSAAHHLDAMQERVAQLEKERDEAVGEREKLRAEVHWLKVTK